MTDKPLQTRLGSAFEIPEVHHASQILSRRRWNNLVRRINALCKLRVVRGGADAPIIVSDGNAVLPLAGGAQNQNLTPAQAWGMYHLTDVSDTYLVGRTWDLANEGASDVYVAKPPEWWTGAGVLDSEDKYGVTHNYSYGEANTGLPDPDSKNKLRLDDWGTGSEVQAMTPPWKIGMVFFARAIPTASTDPNGQPIILLWDSPPRQWAKFAT